MLHSPVRTIISDHKQTFPASALRTSVNEAFQVSNLAGVTGWPASMEISVRCSTSCRVHMDCLDPSRTQNQRQQVPPGRILALKEASDIARLHIPFAVPSI